MNMDLQNHPKLQAMFPIYHSVFTGLIEAGHQLARISTNNVPELEQVLDVVQAAPARAAAESLVTRKLTREEHAGYYRFGQAVLGSVAELAVDHGIEQVTRPGLLGMYDKEVFVGRPIELNPADPRGVYVSAYLDLVADPCEELNPAAIDPEQLSVRSPERPWPWVMQFGLDVYIDYPTAGTEPVRKIYSDHGWGRDVRSGLRSSAANLYDMYEMADTIAGLTRCVLEIAD
jgi:hypothetical protein